MTPMMTRATTTTSTSTITSAHSGSTWVFSGPLSTKNKTELISGVLGPFITGTKTILVGWITKHFEKFPHLKEDPWFIFLFECAPRGQKWAAPVHDATGLEPPTQQHHLKSPPFENFMQITQFPVVSSSHIQLPFHLFPLVTSIPFLWSLLITLLDIVLCLKFKCLSYFKLQCDTLPIFKLSACQTLKFQGDTPVTRVLHISVFSPLLSHSPTASIYYLKIL